MPAAEEIPERSVGALPGRNVAPTVSTTGILERSMRPADWNSGENNRAFYPDPGELAWERTQQMNEEQTQPQTSEADANGSAAVQQPQVPKRGPGRPKKSVSNEDPRAGRGVDVPVSRVPRRRDPDETELPAVREPRANQGRQAARQPSDLKEDATVTEAQWNQKRLEAIAGITAYEHYVQEAPLKDGFTLFNEVSRRVVESGQMLEDRRLEEKKGENSCSFCDHVFTYRGTDMHFGRRSFDLPNGQVQVVMCCKKQKCQNEFDDYVNEMSMRSRETLH